MSQQLNGAVKNTTVTAESESNDEVWRRFSQDDGESDIDWDEATLAKLLEFDDDDSVAGSTVVSAEVTQSEQIQTANANSNVITQSELFDDPHTGKTQPTLAGNPYAKFGTVGLGLGGVFITSAFFLNTIMRGKPKIAPEMVKTTSKPEVFAVDKEQEEVETGKLKAELALGKQAEQIKSVEAAKSPKPVTSTRSKTTSKPSSTPEPPSTVREVEFTPPRNYPRQSKLSVAPRRFPVRQRAVVTVKNNAPRVQGQQLPSVQPADPMEEWLAMNRLGSYGSGEVVPNAETDSSFVTHVAVRQSDQKKASSSSAPTNDQNPDVVVAPKATPVVFSHEDSSNAIALSNSEKALRPDPNLEQNILTGTPVLSNNEKALQPDPNLEKNILTSTPVQQLRVGMTAIGKIAIPMVWANSGTAQTKSDERSPGEENFVVRLSQPIVDDQGYEVMPAGSEIVCTVQGVHKSGASTVQATRLVVDGREYVLPKGAIAITGKGGHPLMASRYIDKGGEIASRDATTFIFGSLAKVGKVLNEPDETSSFASVGIGGSTSTTSIKRRKPNLLGAVLEGGFTPLTQQILARNQAALAEISKREDVWYVRAGTDVQVVVNQSFEL